ncbi:MAG: NAD-dependent epimerase/dehydratase family protein [Novosphingobium sp.]
MKVAITGANGFVGSSLVAAFAAAGHDVRAAARRPVPGLPDSATWVRAPDLGPAGDWRAVVLGREVVVHAAARVHRLTDRSPDPEAEYRAANVDGTLALARQAAAAGVARFVFLSSIKVNGEATPPGRAFRAADPPAPVDAYGGSKAQAEAALFALGRESGMEITVIRPVLVYGPGVGANFAAMVRAVARRVPLPLGAVRNRRSLLFVGNLSSLALCAAAHPNAPGRVFLASDGEDLSTPAMLRRLARPLGRRALLVPVPPGLLRAAGRIAGRTSQVERLLGSLEVDLEPTRRALGWSPPFSIDEGFAATTAAFLEGG